MTPRRTPPGDTAPATTAPTTAPATTPTAPATPSPRPATAATAGAAPLPPAPAGGTVSTRPTASSTSPALAGHNPNVVLPRHQMTPGQRRALDRQNAEAIKKRDETVANYLRSVMPADEPEESEQPAASEPTTPNAES